MAGDPCAGDPDQEAARIAEQRAHGAVAVVTPACFDVELLDRFLTALGGDVPVIVGLLPLRSAEHADFLHHEVPGIRIPDPLRERLRTASDPVAVGLELARETLAQLPDRAAGVHVTAPYRKSERARSVIGDLGLDAVSGISLAASG